MKTDQLISYINLHRANGRADFAIDETAVINAHLQSKSAYSKIIIKALSIFGGILGSLFFFGFLALTRVLESDTLVAVIGAVCVAGSLLIGRMVTNLVLDTAIVCFYILGVCLLCMGIYELLNSEISIIYCIFLCGIAAPLLTDRFVPVFLGTLMCLGAFVGYFALKTDNGLLEFPLIITEAGLIWLTVNEPKLLASGQKINSLLKPMQAAFFIAFIGCLYYLHQQSPMADASFPGLYVRWFAAAAIWLAIFLTADSIMNNIHVPLRNRIIIMTFVTAIAVPLFFATYLSGALLLVLITFHYGLVTELVISLLFMVYGISRYYYDLQLTLLVKSGILCLSGLLVGLLWLFIRSQKNADEQA